MERLPTFPSQPDAAKVELVWCPDQSEYQSLMWTVFPDQVGEAHPRNGDCEPWMADPGWEVTVPMTEELREKLHCWCIVTSLPVSQLIRRLLEMEVTQYGRFKPVDTP